jgi:molecular chaperone DnaK
MQRTIGIDFGANSSMVAYVDKMTGEARCIPGPYGDILCPSIVSIDADGDLIVGAPAARRIATQPDRTTRSVKHAMGRGPEEIDEKSKAELPLHVDANTREVTGVRLGDNIYTLPELSACVFRELKTWAEVFFGEAVSEAVIAMPAYFSASQRQATQQAAELAGLNVLHFVPEPAAAALAYGLHKQQRAHVAVCDLGGRRFEFSVLRLANSDLAAGYEVIATRSDSEMGGERFDDALLSVAQEEIRSHHGVDLARDVKAAEMLRRELIRAKHELSFGMTAKVEVPLPNRSLYVREFSRAEFEGLVQAIVDRMVDSMRKVLADTGIAPEKIDAVVVVGGAAHIPLVRRTVEQIFRRRPVEGIDPEQAVALGAAIQADVAEKSAKAVQAENLAS